MNNKLVELVIWLIKELPAGVWLEAMRDTEAAIKIRKLANTDTWNIQEVWDENQTTGI